jgi:hypothetical protein
MLESRTDKPPAQSAVPKVDANLSRLASVRQAGAQTLRGRFGLRPAGENLGIVHLWLANGPTVSQGFDDDDADHAFTPPPRRFHFPLTPRWKGERADFWQTNVTRI